MRVFADRKKRSLLLLGAGLLLAALSAMQVQRIAADAESRVGPLVDVVVAQREVPSGKRITERNNAAYFSVAQVAERFAPKARFATATEMIGMQTRSIIPDGTYPSYGAFAVQDGKELALRNGWRAVQVAAVGFDELAPIGPGSRVDVVVSGSQRGGITQLFLQDVEVGAVGQQVVSPEAQESQHETHLVTLLARPPIAVKLAAADNFAKELRLLARPGGDRRDAGSPRVRAWAFGGGAR